MGKVLSNNHSNESVNGVNNDGKKSSKRKRLESPYLKVRSKAANIFRNQIDKSVETKRRAFERAFNKVVSGNFTRERFLSEFKVNVDLLLDSKRFEKDCKNYSLASFNVATHIVFDGASKIELVLKNGLYANYSTQFTELVHPLFTEDELISASQVKSEETAHE
jgi:hypothetical protein